MILHSESVVLKNGVPQTSSDITEAREKTLAYQILQAHNSTEDANTLHLKFDSLTSHDITYVGIIATARASGMERFPIPYVLTNCHNTLCAVGGTINEDDHQFALSAAHKYGGIYVPPCLAVIHSYNREVMSGCGRMILGSDSHTRYGALGTMGVGEGGGELAKQLVSRTYDMKKPEVILVYVTGKCKPGVGPHDVALSLVEATYANGFVKNKVLEFVGPGISTLSQDTRNAIDCMTTETTCWSSIWETDEITHAYYQNHQREEAYQPLQAPENAGYDGWIELNLSEVECMIALPMHPSHAVSIHALQNDPRRFLQEAQDHANQQLNQTATMNLVDHIDADGNVHVDQGIIAGCAGGTFDSITAAASILENANCGNAEFRLSVYPDSLPVYKALVENGTVSKILSSGAIFREAFCGPCFGAGDTPGNNEFSIRHTTRNFPNREGSKPGEGQISSVALMDARSIVATATNQGILTAASDVVKEEIPLMDMHYDPSIYEKRVYNGWNHPESDTELRFGPNIKDWPTIPTLSDHLLVNVISYLDDPVTTTDELIPSGETSSYRSNPLRLAEFTLSRRDPSYVPLAKEVQLEEQARENGKIPESLKPALDTFAQNGILIDLTKTRIGSSLYANKPGDGSAREQAASCQRVLGGSANFAREYATKRYRSNCINWGILPFLTTDATVLKKGCVVYIPNVRTILHSGSDDYSAVVWNPDTSITSITLHLGALTSEERETLEAGCLINHYQHH